MIEECVSHVAVGLRLRPITLHDVLERLVLVCHLRRDVDGAQEQLVQVSVHHELSAVNQRELEAGPDLPPELRGDVQFGTEVSQTQTRQMVNLGNDSSVRISNAVTVLLSLQLF